MTQRILPLFFLAALVAGCKDGRHLFTGQLEPAPFVPSAPQADTTPVQIFTATATALAAPSAPGYAGTPSGIAFVRADTLGVGRETDPGVIAADEAQLEDSDALVCDPGNGRLVLVKARVRQAFQAIVFGPALATPTAVFVTTDRHALAATSGGYSTLDATGITVTAHALGGGPFVAITFSESGNVLFIASSSQIQRLSVDANLAPFTAPAVIYDNLGATTIRGLALRNDGALFFTDGVLLRRILSASTLQTVDDIHTFTGGDEPRGLLLNSIGSAIVAVANGVAGRLVEIPDTGAVLSTLVLGAPPTAVGIDTLHSAVAWTGPGGLTVQIEPAPDLTKRVLPVFAGRSCVDCHLPNSGFTTTPLDLTTASAARATLLGVTRDCVGSNCAPNNAVRVVASSSATSFLIDKLRGCRNGTQFAACDDRMPLDASTLFPQRPVPQIEIDIIAHWIDAGANP